jgi:hypothetical protein
MTRKFDNAPCPAGSLQPRVHPHNSDLASNDARRRTHDPLQISLLHPFVRSTSRGPVRRPVGRRPRADGITRAALRLRIPKTSRATVR